VTRISIFLIVAALVVGIVGYTSSPTQYTLTISSSEGGKVTTPGEGSFTYDEGTEVDLVAEADEGYQFVSWSSGPGFLRSPVADARAAATTIVMNRDYSISANFAVPVLVRNWYDLNAIRDGPGGVYILMNDLNSSTPGYEEMAGPTANGGKGWQSIASTNESSPASFVGTLDGRGHEIRDLFIDRPDENGVGLFGTVWLGGGITNLSVVNATVTGYMSVATLVAANFGTVANCHSASSVNGTIVVGGLAGYNEGTVTNCHSGSSVNGTNSVGGLVGGNGGTVSDSSVTGSVSGSGYFVGGLVGYSEGTVIDCYSASSVTGGGICVGSLVGQNYGTVGSSYCTGSVSGNRFVGGLVGYNAAGSGSGSMVYSTVSNSYSTGTVTGDSYVGGLVAANEGTIGNSYSIGNVTGDQYASGLVGENYGSVIDCYSAGSVAGNSSGGLVVDNHGTVGDSFWDTQTSGQSTSASGTGKTTEEMKCIATFSGATWNITAVALNQTNPAYIWNIVDNVTYPFLSWQS
jgi:hypothetical protein